MFVYIVQADTFQGHKHYTNSGNSASSPTGNYPIAQWNRPGLDIMNTTGINTDNTNGTPRYGNETRPINITIKMWKRIA